MSSHDWWDVKCKVRDDEMMKSENGYKGEDAKVGEAGVMGRKPDSSEFMMSSGKMPKTSSYGVEGQKKAGFRIIGDRSIGGKIGRSAGETNRR
jgi:hypothetical protein